MNFKDALKILSLIFLAGAIAFSPSFPAGKLADGKVIEIRIEDILIFILGFLLIVNFLASEKTKTERPPLFFPILAWLSMGFLSVLTNWSFSDLDIGRGFFYSLKEVQFFIFYFYVFWSIKKIDSAKLLVKVWVIFASINVLYVIYQMIFGSKRGYYGTAAIGEWGPFPTGAFFSLIFIFLFNLFLYYFLNLKNSAFLKITLGIFTFSPVLGVIGSGSQTAFLATGFAIFLSLFFYFLKSQKSKKMILFFVLIVLLLTFLLIIFYFESYNILGASRGKDVLSLKNAYDLYLIKRWDDIIKPLFLRFSGEMSFLDIILGKGKGYVGEAHNQYLRNFIETGIIGSLIFFILIFSIIGKSWKGFSKNRDRFAVGLSAGLLISTITLLFISFATEPFIVVKPSSVYWFFAAMALTVLSLNKK